MQSQEPNHPRPSLVDSAGKAWVVFDSLAVVTEPFAAISFGKNYFGRNVFFGAIVLAGWLLAYPQNAEVLTGYATAWAVALAFQMVVSRFNHFFGRRQMTTFVGIPLVSYLLPFSEHFCRRFVTPLLIFGAGCGVGDPALATLFKFSAIGHFVSCVFSSALDSADEDARSDAMITMRSR